VSPLINIEVDDIVVLNKNSKHYKKWGKYDFTVSNIYPDEKRVRLQRHMKNKKMGLTNCYYVDDLISVNVKEKNGAYAERIEQDKKMEEYLNLL
jgi:hypothetical protein